MSSTEVTPTPKPTPKEILDPTIARKKAAQAKAAKQKAAAEKAAAAKAAADKAAKERAFRTQQQKENMANALLNFSDPSVQVKSSNPFDTNGETVAATFWDLMSGINTAYNYQSGKEANNNFIEYKNKLITLAKLFENKYKVSPLDVLSSDVYPTVRGQAINLKNIKPITNLMYQIFSDNPQADYKFIAPKVFKPKGPASGDKSFTGPVTLAPKPGITTTPTTNPSTYNWDISQDSQGNMVYMWGGNSSNAVPVAFLGDYATGNYIRHNANYKRGTAMGINDPNSPQSVDEAYNMVFDKLQSTPGAVENFKRIALAKHIIPASKTQIVMNEPSVIDSTTAAAIGQVIALTTAYNVNLSKSSNANQKFMSFDHYLNHMNALSETDISTRRIQTKVNPNDYELSIDQMFQNILGRGASKDELTHFTKQLQAYANKHPEVTTTTSTPTATGTNSSSVQSGGLSSDAAGAIMRDQALHTQGAEKYTKGSKYFNWFQQALNGQSQIGR